MKAVIQRVDRAVVKTNGIVTATIGCGLLIFVGIEKGDSRSDADYLLSKIVNLRIFQDDRGKMNLSLLEHNGELLVVSQFTLLGDCRKGRRPSFGQAEEPKRAQELYNYFLSQARLKVSMVAEGSFQQLMKIELVNDGPVTMIIDSKKGGTLPSDE